MRATRRQAAAVLLAAGLAACVLGACGKTHPPQRGAGTPPIAPVKPASGALATGIDEENANLVNSSAALPVPPAGVGPWRDRLVALRPAIYRLDVNWAAVQPTAAAPPNWDAVQAGCGRSVAPCAPYAGVRAQLRAVRSQQQAGGGFALLVVILGVPSWAAGPSHGCVPDSPSETAGAIAPAMLPAYRRMLDSLLSLARQEKVAVRYLSPLNEPNHTGFLYPQRASCSVDSPTLAAGVYAQLARAARAALDATSGDHELLLGETAGYADPQPKATGTAEFAQALPADVVCAARIWDQHAYVGTPGGGSAALAADPTLDAAEPLLADLERALDARPCPGPPKRIWITETGVGGPHPGGPRPTDGASLRAGCRAMDSALRRWYRDPRVDVAVQYTFRQDDQFPVGLAASALTRAYPTYDLWRAWGARAPQDPPPSLPGSCA